MSLAGVVWCTPSGSAVETTMVQYTMLALLGVSVWASGVVRNARWFVRLCAVLYLTVLWFVLVFAQTALEMERPCAVACRALQSGASDVLQTLWYDSLNVLGFPDALFASVASFGFAFLWIETLERRRANHARTRMRWREGLVWVGAVAWFSAVELQTGRTTPGLWVANLVLTVALAALAVVAWFAFARRRPFILNTYGASGVTYRA